MTINKDKGGKDDEAEKKSAGRGRGLRITGTREENYAGNPSAGPLTPERPAGISNWWRKRDLSRTLTLPLNGSPETSAQLHDVTRLLKQLPLPTGLELAEAYERVAQEHGIRTSKQLAHHLGKPYRTVKQVVRLLKLCPEAKSLIRQASKDKQLRRRLSAHALESIHVRASAKTQLARLRKLLSNNS